MINEPSPQSNLQFVVGIGGSAGSLRAYEVILENLPVLEGVTYVMVQHMDPEQKSMLAELLGRKSKFPVLQAANGMLLQPNHVYVARPGFTMEFRGRVIYSHSMEKISERRNSIDTTFDSLARTFGERSVGILVSGTGTDGSVGLRKIKEFSGTTIVQDPKESRFDGMPRNAIQEGLADYIVPCKNVGDLLRSLVERHEPSPKNSGVLNLSVKDELVLDKICSELLQKTGHDFSSYKKTTVSRRIEKRLQNRHIESFEAYLDLLVQDSAEAELLLKDLLISVTCFFRDAETFSFLRDDIIPKLFSGASGGEPIRIWIPACATGEEAYSFAMLMKEHKARTSSSIDFQIFATDIDKQALEVARKGVYSEGSVAEVDAGLLGLHFVKGEKGYQVTPELREVCIFSEHNVIKDPPFSKLNLISCRNLLIYLEPELQSKVISVFNYALLPEGHLLLGPAENVSGMASAFRTLNKKHRVFQKVESKLLSSMSFQPQSIKPLAKIQFEPQKGFTSPEEKTATSMISTYLLTHHALPAVVVNEKGEISYFSGQTGKYLEPPTGAPSTNIFENILKPLKPALYTLVHKAVKEQIEVAHPPVAFERPAGVSKIYLRCKPLPDLPGQYIVVFQETAAEEGENLPPVLTSSTADSAIYQMELELKETREHLQSTIEQIKSTNEELLSMNEELQSANEEMQTSKEELQSTNEEIETVNSELTRKMEELDLANTDLQNFFANAMVPIIFLNNNLQIQKFTPTASKIYRLVPSDVGRSITDIVSLLENRDFLSEMNAVLQTLQSVEKEVATTDRLSRYMMRINPYRPNLNTIGGLVLTFADITEQKQVELKLKESLGQTVDILESMGDAFVSFDENWRVTRVNSVHERITQRSRQELLGKIIWELFPQASDPASKYWSELNRVMKDRIPRRFEEYYEPLDIWTGVDAYPTSGGSIAVFYRDITTEKKAKKDAEETQTLFKNLANSISQLTWMANADGSINWYNQSWYDYTGTTFEDMKGQGWVKCHHPEHLDRVVAFVEKAWVSGERWELTFPLRRNDGEYRWFLTRGVPIKDDKGQLKGWLGTNTDIHEITEAKNAIEYQSYLNKTITDNAASCLFMMDEKGHPTFMNPAAVELTGYTLDEIKDKPLHYAVHYRKPDGSHYPMEECPIDNAQAELKKVQNAEEIFVDKHGRLFPVSYSVNPLEINGRVIGSVLEFRDISDVKTSEIKLQSEKQKFEAIFVESPSCMALLKGEDLVFDKVNPKYLELIGNRDIIGKPLREALPELEGQPFLDLIQRVYQTGEPYIGVDAKALLTRTPGQAPEEIYIDFTYLRIDDGEGNPYGIYVHAMDVTEKFLARHRLEEAQERLRVALESAQMGTWDLNPQTGGVRWSPRTNQLFGVDLKDGFPLEAALKRIHPDDLERVNTHISAAIQGEDDGFYDVDYRVCQEDGSYIWITAKGQSYFATIDGKQVCTKFSGVVFDINDKKVIEERLKEAIKTRDQFLSIASHELKTPLTSLNLQIQLRKRMLETKGIQAFDLEKFNFMISKDGTSVKRIIRLIDDMLDISRINSGKLTMTPEKVELGMLVKDVVERFGEQALGAGSTVTTDLCQNAVGFWDRFRIEQVITNLFTNAIKYGDGKPIHLELKVEGNQTVLKVKDHGFGIADTDHARIFSQFERAVSDSGITGLGLGLYIVSEILSAHQGSIHVESKLGEGSTFVMKLPLHDSAEGS